MTAAATTIERTTCRAGLLPRPMSILIAWHGLFAGAYLTAALTAEIWPVGHGVAGLTALALLLLRLAAAGLAPSGSLAALPWPKPGAWTHMAKKLAAGRWEIMASRTPLTPIVSLAAMAGGLLAASSGALALAWGWNDPHEALAEFSLMLIGAHVAMIALGAGLRALTARFSAAA